MIKRVLAAAAVSLLALLGGLAVAAPASAAAPWGCSSDAVCLYQWTNYSGPQGVSGRWQSSFSNIYAHTNGCLDLDSPVAFWPNGDEVNNRSSSLVINGIPGGGWGTGYSISFFNSAGCSYANGVSSRLTDSYQGVSNLSNMLLGYGYNGYDTISSMQIKYGCPPNGC